MADPQPVAPPPAPILKRDLLKQRASEAKGKLLPEEIAPTLARVKDLKKAKDILAPLVGTLLHPRTADLKRKGRVLVKAPLPFKPATPPSAGAPPATLREWAAVGGKLRGTKKWKTEKQRREALRKIGRKGGLAKARKRQAIIEALDKIQRKLVRDRKALLKAGVPASELD